MSNRTMRIVPDMRAVVQLLARRRFHVARQGRLPNDLGWKIVLVSGQHVNVYDTGAATVQGRDTECVESVLAELEVPRRRKLLCVVVSDRPVIVRQGRAKDGKTLVKVFVSD